MPFCVTPDFPSYKYDTFIQTVQNESVSVGACVDPLNQPDVLKIQNKSSVEHTKGTTEAFQIQTE